MDSVAVVRRVFDAFARRDVDAVVELIDPAVEFHAPTADVAHAGEPYRGHAGIRDYFRDVEKVWIELDLHPEIFRALAEDGVLVTGRVWGRGELGVIDSSAGWIWKLGGGRVRYIHAFRSAEEALQASRS